MVRTRFSPSEEELQDPVVEIRESQLRRLRSRANFAIPSAILGLLAWGMIAAGMVRVERSLAELDARAERRSAAVGDQMRAWSEQLAKATDPQSIARIATEANAAPIARASSNARRALSAALETASATDSVTERVEVVESEMIRNRSELEALSERETAQAARDVALSQGLDSLRVLQDERAESLARRIASHEDRLDSQDQEVKSTRTWMRAVAAGAAIGIGIAGSHALGHDGR